MSWDPGRDPYAPGPDGAPPPTLHLPRPSPTPPAVLVQPPLSGSAVAGFVLSFILAPLGLALSLVGLGATRGGRARGRGLAVSGTVISSAVVLLWLAVLATAGPDGEDGVVASPDAAQPADAADPADSADASGAEPEDPPPPDTGDAAPEAEPTLPGIGEAVTDGEFTFTVTGIERPGTTVGSELWQGTAQGEFVVVRVTVTNTGDEARAFTAGEQRLYDVEGREYRTSSAVVFVEGAGRAIWETINPGNTVTDAPLVFDVPPGLTLDRLELHDTFYSRGVEVSLR